MNDTPSEPATTVAGRYQIQTTLGAGTQGRTFLATDLDEEREVVLKRLAMTDAPDWKTIELFERQRDVLRDLDHPGIPSYHDAFQEERDGVATFYIVREYVAGENLEGLCGDPASWSAGDIQDFARQMLDILEYLESRRPPVVHRDIKPQNIMRTPEGTYRLIDFGAVQNAIMRETGGSTLIGTKGYLPVEQLMGRASPASDQFALGMTIAALLFGEPPADQAPEEIRDRVERETGDTQLASMVERLVQKQPDDRFERASEARSQLEATPSPQTNTSKALVESPSRDVKEVFDDSQFDIEKHRDSVTVTPKTTEKPREKSGLGVAIGWLMLAGSGAFGIVMFFILPDLMIASLPLGLVAGVTLFASYGGGSSTKEWKFVLDDDKVEISGGGRVRSYDQSLSRIWLDDIVEVSSSGNTITLVTGDKAFELPWFGRQSDAVAELVRERVDAAKRQLE